MGVQMKPNEMRAIYEEACCASSNRQLPEEAQLKIWQQQMGGFDAGDLRAGIAVWWQTEKYLPMPAELKPLAEAARRKRLALSSSEKFLVRWKCPDCSRTQSGIISTKYMDTPARYCSGPKLESRMEGHVRRCAVRPDGFFGEFICGATMEEIHREFLEKRRNA